MSKKLTHDIPDKPVSAYIYAKHRDGIDISDTDWDGADICICCPDDWDECKDGYDKFILLVAINLPIRTVPYDPNDPYLADIGFFVWDNREVFEPFFNTNNRRGYRPKDYDNISPDEDTGFYEAYILPFISLVNGDYTDKEYLELYNMLKDQEV